MNNRARYPPPGIGNGRGAVGNPNYYPRGPPTQQQQQQYVQRNLMQNQQQNQQQWLRRNQIGSESGASESNKAVQSSTVDTRYWRNPRFEFVEYQGNLLSWLWFWSQLHCLNVLLCKVEIFCCVLLIFYIVRECVLFKDLVIQKRRSQMLGLERCIYL